MHVIERTWHKKGAERHEMNLLGAKKRNRNRDRCPVLPCSGGHTCECVRVAFIAVRCLWRAVRGPCKGRAQGRDTEESHLIPDTYTTTLSCLIKPLGRRDSFPSRRHRDPPNVRICSLSQPLAASLVGQRRPGVFLSFPFS